MLAADLELRTPTLFVGEKTGGHPNSYGDSRRIVLPNSGLTVRVSSLFWQLTGPQDRRDGIVPHIAVEPRFADWRANRDPVLDVAIARAGTNADVAGRWKGEIGWRSERLPLRLELVSGFTAWTGRVDLPGAGLSEAPLAAASVADGLVTARWDSDGETWSLSGRLAGERLVAVVRYKGLDFAAVLERDGPSRATR